MSGGGAGCFPMEEEKKMCGKRESLLCTAAASCNFKMRGEREIEGRYNEKHLEGKC